jgi:hypothetical protein
VPIYDSRRSIRWTLVMQTYRVKSNKTVHIKSVRVSRVLDTSGCPQQPLLLGTFLGQRFPPWAREFLLVKLICEFRLSYSSLARERMVMLQNFMDKSNSESTNFRRRVILRLSLPFLSVQVPRVFQSSQAFCQ